MIEEPLDPSEAKKLARKICDHGTVEFSGHALRELKKDNLSEIDAVNVLRGGWPDPAEFENGSWRYRFQTAKICVVAAFRSEEWTVIVTGWRKGR